MRRGFPAIPSRNIYNPLGNFACVAPFGRLPFLGDVRSGNADPRGGLCSRELQSGLLVEPTPALLRGRKRCRKMRCYEPRPPFSVSATDGDAQMIQFSPNELVS